MQSTILYWLECEWHALPDGLEWLTDRESEFLQRLRFAKRRSDWLLGRWTAKCAIARFLKRPASFEVLQSIEVMPAANGAPEISCGGTSANIQISLSHREGRALAVIGAGDMKFGCDLELIESRSENFIHDYLTAEEASAISEYRTPEKRMQAANLMWSAKESVLKLLRSGLTRDTRDVPIEIETWCDGWSRFSARCDSEIYCGEWLSDGKWIKTIAAENFALPLELPMTDFE